MLDGQNFLWQLFFGKTPRNIQHDDGVVNSIPIRIQIVNFLFNARQRLTPSLKHKLPCPFWKIVFPMVGIESTTAGTPENKGIVMVLGIVPQKQFRRQVITIGLIKVLQAEWTQSFKRICN